MDENTKKELQSAAFERLLNHLRDRKDVQNVDHPRWSQATERVIGTGIWTPRIKTLMFNGYADEVAQLYSGMDLKKYF